MPTGQHQRKWPADPFPWLNPIEPRWVHAKRNVVEHNGLLTAHQLAERVCTYFGCSYEPQLAIVEKVA